MRYSILNFIVCPRCHGDLTAITLRERACKMSPVGLEPFTRVSQANVVVGPAAEVAQPSALGRVLAALSTAPAPVDRNYDVAMEEGVLACGACGNWFPVTRCIPELLPDHLRDWARDRAWLEERASVVPEALSRAMLTYAPVIAAEDAGAHHKFAEISLPSKITDPLFFGPGYVSPFNLWSPEHTWHLIRNFAVAEPLLEAQRGHVILDMGSGYSWTTEWMLRGGYEPLGMDICRTYLEVALERIGPVRPHLFVGEVEHTPVRDECVHSVVAFEAFHHIPNRRAAMGEFARVLKPGRPIVLVEPGAAHEHATTSVDVMEKYGTLEKGMELEDVAGYAEGTGLGDCLEQMVLRAPRAIGGAANFQSGQTTPAMANHLYTLRKPQTGWTARMRGLMDSATSGT